MNPEERHRAHHQKLAELHARWNQIARDRRHAQTIHTAYFRAVVGPDLQSERVRNWIAKCVDLEHFALDTSRLPRREVADVRERRLFDWVQYQRRNVDRLTLYQVERLELLDEWTWSPLDERWLRNLEAYEDFCRTHGRIPRRRTSDQAEASLATWRDVQHARARKETLPAWREAALRYLEQRRWSPRL